MRLTLTAAAMTLAVGAGAIAQDAPPFGSEEDVSYAGDLWEEMQAQGLVGEGAVMAAPYAGTTPHGAMLETFYSSAEIDGHEGVLVVKRNYLPEGITADDVLAAPQEHLDSVTVMFAREEGYDPETGDWFYAKYAADGELNRNPDDRPLAGLVGKGADMGCIACHSGAPGEDYLFTTDAELAVR